MMLSSFCPNDCDKKEANPYRPLYNDTAKIPPKPLLDTRQILSKSVVCNALIDLCKSAMIPATEVIKWECTGILSDETRALVEKATGGRVGGHTLWRDQC